MQPDDSSPGSTPAQLMAQTHQKMLSILQAAQLSHLSQLIGKLAVTKTPDFSAAAVDFDKTLTAEQRECIRTTDAAARDEIDKIMGAISKGETTSHNVVRSANADLWPVETISEPSMILLRSTIEQLMRILNRAKQAPYREK